MDDPRQGKPAPSMKGAIISCILLAFFAVLVYGGYLGNEWVYDDQILIVERDWYEKPFEPADVFKDLGVALYEKEMGYWRPGQLLLYRAEYELFEKNPMGWHATALFLHLLASIAFFFLMRRLVKGNLVAWLCSLLFMLHPLTNEVVGSNNFQISSAEGVLAFFALLSWIGRKNAVALVLFVAALSFRESTVVLPLAFGILSYVGFGESGKRAVAWIGGAFALAVAYFAVRFVILSQTLLTATEPMGLFERISGVAYLAVKVIFSPTPTVLSIFHEVNPTLLQMILGWAAIALCVAVLVLLWAKSVQGGNKITAALFTCSLLFAAPYSGIIQPFVLFAEHYYYLPLAFLLGAIFSFLSETKHRAALTVGSLIIATFFGYVGMVRTDIFKDNMSAFSDVLKKYPASVKAHMTVADEYYEAMNLEAAALHYYQVIKATDGKHELAWSNLGDIYFRNREWGSAEECFKKAGNEGKRNLAILYYIQKRKDELKPLLDHLAEKNPDDELIWEMRQFVDAIPTESQ